ncbi:MAG: hypothetical protein SGPRY_012562 [Prymnesium sp.]
MRALEAKGEAKADGREESEEGWGGTLYVGKGEDSPSGEDQGDVEWPPEIVTSSDWQQDGSESEEEVGCQQQVMWRVIDTPEDGDGGPAALSSRREFRPAVAHDGLAMGRPGSARPRTGGGLIPRANSAPENCLETELALPVWPT